MVHPACLEIAAVSFEISSPYILLPPDPQLVYRPFLLSQKKQPETVRIPVSLKVDVFPELTTTKQVFDSGQSWSMFAEGDEHLLMFNAGGPAQNALWMAKFDQRVREVTLYCGRRLIHERLGKTMLMNPLAYPLDQLLLMHVLATREGILLHAAGAGRDGKGYLFLGPSGAGKSTLAQILSAARGTEVISDDRMVVRKVRGRFKTYGTPWPGELGAALNKSVPLAAIFFLSHGTDTRIEPLTLRQAVERLLPVASIPWYDRLVTPKVLAFCEDLLTHVPAYELEFRPSPEVARAFQDWARERTSARKKR